MYPTDYKYYYTLDDVPATVKDLRTITLRSSSKVSSCPKCGSWSLGKHCPTKHVVRDITSDTGEYVSILLSGLRYKCKDCGVSFADFAYNDVIAERTKVTQDFKEKATVDVLTGTESILSIARKAKLSSPIISKGVNERLDAMMSVIKSYLFCKELFFLPESYQRKPICVVCGIDEFDDPVLLDIIEGYDTESLKLTLEKVTYGPDKASADFNRPVLNLLHSQWDDSKIAVLLQSIKEFVNEFQKDNGDGLWSKKMKATKTLFDALNQSDNSDFTERINTWWAEVDESVKDELIPLYKRIEEYPEELINSFPANDTAIIFKDKLEFLHEFNHKKQSLQRLRFKLLQSGNIKEQNEEKYFAMFKLTAPVKLPTIENFYISIDKINQQYKDWLAPEEWSYERYLMTGRDV